jgi:hypothetical protein
VHHATRGQPGGRHDEQRGRDVPDQPQRCATAASSCHDVMAEPARRAGPESQVGLPRALRHLPAAGPATDDHLVERNAARRSKSWRDLSERQKAAVVVAGAAELGMAAAAWADLARRPADQVRGPKWRWALLIAVNFIGPIAYFRLGRVHQAPAARR